MKIYGVAAAAYQTKAQLESGTKENTLSITPVVYDSEKIISDSERGGFEPALNGQIKHIFKIDSKPGVKAAAEKFCEVVAAVAKLQEQADSSISMPVIFGFSRNFFDNHLGDLTSRLKALHGAGHAQKRDNYFQIRSYIGNLLRNCGVDKFELDSRIAQINEEGLERLKGIELKSIQAANKSEITTEILQEMATDAANAIRKAQFEARQATGYSSSSTFVQLAPPADRFEAFLPYLKTVSENKELRQQLAAAICKELQFHEPFVLKTPFDVSSPAFYDVVSRHIAFAAAKLDPSLKGKMLGDFVYIPDPCY